MLITAYIVGKTVNNTNFYQEVPVVCFHKIESNPEIERSDLLIRAIIRMTQNIMLSKRGQMKEHTLYDSIYIRP